MPSMPARLRSRRMLIAVLSAAVVALSTGCAEPGTSNSRAPTDASSTGSPQSSPGPDRSGPAGSGTSSSTSSSDSDRENPMKVQITIGDQRFQATLSDTAATRDLLAQLPVTIGMVDHGAVEKTGPLLAPLSLDDQPEGADPDVGDVGYYAPGNDLVFYYGDQSYFPGIVILGRLDGDAAQRISDLEGPITATVEPHGD